MYRVNFSSFFPALRNGMFVSVWYQSNGKNIAKLVTILKLCKISFRWDLAGCLSFIRLEVALGWRQVVRNWKSPLKANVTVPQQAGGPDFPPIYVSTSFRYIIICGLNGSKTFMTTQCTISNHFLWPSLPLGGLKIWSKSFFWLVSILSPVENSKQNQLRNVFFYDFMSFHHLVVVPLDTQKNSTHYWNKELSKNGVNIKFSLPRFFCFFSPKADHYNTYFYLTHFALTLSIFSFTIQWTTTWGTFPSIFMLLGWS